MHTILVLGAYGFFGARICRALAKNPAIHLLLAGRDAGKARALAAELALPPDRAHALDASAGDLAQRLAALGVQTLVHTAGPFQAQDYHVARTAIEARSNYIDLADGRQFVAHIGMLDADARAANVSVISGCSSLPALSSAVVDRYRPRFTELHTVRLGIGTGGRAPGIATMQAIFSYCGKPFAAWENSERLIVHGWMDTVRHEFPAPIGRRFLGRCDVPELDLFPQRYPGLHSVSFHAGFVNDFAHLTTLALSALVRLRILPSLRPLAPALHGVTQWLEPWLEPSGAMFVTLEGIGANNAPLSLTWNLVAGSNHGPHIPCGAAIALANKFAAQEKLPVGAMPCMGLLSVEEFLESVRDLDIRVIAPAAASF